MMYLIQRGNSILNVYRSWQYSLFLVPRSRPLVVWWRPTGTGDIYFFTASRLSLNHNQALTKSLKVPFPGVKQPRSKVDHSPTFSIEVKYASISSHLPYKFSWNDTDLRIGVLHCYPQLSLHTVSHYGEYIKQHKQTLLILSNYDLY
jgi:hypothetical protein